MILRLPGVFRPVSDAQLLIGAVLREIEAGATNVVDLCTGSGIVGVEAARRGASVTAIDVSRRALASARANALLSRVPLRTRRGDLLAPLDGERVDVIAVNPPYVPGPAEDPQGAARAWEGGSDGRVLIDRICAEAPRHLRPGGALVMVHSSLCGVEPTLDALHDGGLAPEVIDRHVGPLGPIVRSRADELRERGLLAPGQDSEELVVIRAAA